MAADGDINDDEYVARLLAKDARESSIKYSAVGLPAYYPKRPTNAAPKPNKRFLTNLIRETDNHNAALKKKEELEARMKLCGEPLAPPRSGRDRSYQDGGVRKRRRVEEPEERSRSRDRKHTSSRSRDYSAERRGSRRDRHRRGRHNENHNGDDERSYRSREHSHRGKGDKHRHGSRNRSRERSASLSDGGNRRQRHAHNRRQSIIFTSSDSDYGKRQRSRPDKDHYDRKRHARPASNLRPRSRSPNSRGMQKNRSPGAESQSHRAPQPSPAGSDSDPLEALVGPLPPPPKNVPINDPPPVTSKGRGAFRPSASAMDARFTSSYDPTIDVQPDSEDENERDDWEMALEAHRDRELWKRKGAQRLREAGFGEEAIKNWKDSGREKGVEDVKWSSKGEAREWDRGKVVETVGDKKGEISLEAAWKRKKGGFMADFKKALG